MSRPRVAVIIPCFDDGETVGETVESVRIQEPCELVIVDDGSTDPATIDSLAALERSGVAVLHQPNAGQSDARMAGVAATSAPYVLPLDADDQLLPDAVSGLADFLDEHPEHSLCWGDVMRFGSADLALPTARRLDPWRVTHFNGIPYCALMRREALLEAGGWRLVDSYEDWDLLMSLADRGKTGLSIRRPTMRYRTHGSRMWAKALERDEAIREDMQRRHPELFAARSRNWRTSQESWKLRLGLPVVTRLPLGPRNRRRLIAALDHPPTALRLGVGRLRRAVGR